MAVNSVGGAAAGRVPTPVEAPKKTAEAADQKLAQAIRARAEKTEKAQSATVRPSSVPAVAKPREAPKQREVRSEQRDDGSGSAKALAAREDQQESGRRGGVNVRV